MGKKKQRAKYTSRGQRKPADKKISNAVRLTKHPIDVMLRKLEAFKAGKRVLFTIENPNIKETAKRYIRIEGSLLYGNFRDFGVPPRKREDAA